MLIAGASASGTALPRSPVLRRQPSAPSAIHTTPLPPPQHYHPGAPSPRLPPLSERGDHHYPPPPSITSVESSSQRPRRKKTLRAPLKRLASYNQNEPVYSSDEDSDSAAEADMQAVQAELERNWESHTQTGTIRHRRRPSAGTSRKGSQKGRLDEEDAGTMRRHQYTSQSFYPRESDIESSGDERPQSRVHRHHHHDDDDDDDDESEVDSQASYTLKDRQDAINITHPFGLKIWKPALYKKSRSVQRTAEGEIHSRPGQWPDRKIRIGNVLWTLLFGIPMSLITAVAGVVILLLSWWSGGSPYALVLFGLARYLFYPFGRFVELTPDEAYAEEDEGEGRSISEYERYGAVDLERGRQLGIFTGSPHPERRRGLIGRQRGHSMGSWGDYSERDSLLGGEERTSENDAEFGPRKRRFFGRGQWSIGRIFFFLTFYLIIGNRFFECTNIAPMLLLVCGFCWLIVFALPMAKVMSVLTDHLRRHPLSMTFYSDLRTAASRRPETPSAQVLLCTYRAWGWEYYKYTIDGTNIFFVNLMFVVFFTIADEYILAPLFHHKGLLVHPALIFTLALASIMPLAYFIGMAVASISAQSSMGMGAAINAFFGSVVEVFLYSVALTQGKSRLVEGSVVGSIFAGILLMPGVSMLCGALKRKTQRFNAKSAGVTSTMLLFAVIGAFAPTLFYQIYGTVRNFSMFLT
jgi:Ca2+:H+ antiporter